MKAINPMKRKIILEFYEGFERGRTFIKIEKQATDKKIPVDKKPYKFAPLQSS